MVSTVPVEVDGRIFQVMPVGKYLGHFKYRGDWFVIPLTGSNMPWMNFVREDSPEDLQRLSADFIIWFERCFPDVKTNEEFLEHCSEAAINWLERQSPESKVVRGT